MSRKLVLATLAITFALPLLATAASCPNLTRNLSSGSRGSDIVQLQQFLISQNLLAADSATGYFGRLTQSAVQKWQCKNMNICSGSPNTNGWGNVGPRTRAAITNACNQKPVVVPTNPTCPLVGYGIKCLPGTHKVRQYDANDCETVPQCVADQTPPVSVNPTPPPPSCSPQSPQTQTLACPSGQTGSITQTRTSSCATGATSPTWNDWQTTTNTCVILPPPANITVHGPETVIPHYDIVKANKAFGVNGWIDGPITTIRIGNENYWYNSNSFRTTKYKGSLDAPFANVISDGPTVGFFTNAQPLSSPQDGTVQAFWIVNTYQDAGGILAFVHTEYPKEQGGNYDTGRGRLGLAWSTDNGNHFTYLGDILKPSGDPATFNIQGAPYILKDGYFYVYFTDTCGNSVARARVSDVIAAVRTGQVTTWNKYSGGGWESAGLGGTCTSINVPGITHTDAAYSTYTNKYYLVTTTMNWNQQDTWVKLYESPDGIAWTPMKTIVQASPTAVKMGYQYASIINADGTDNGVVGSSFFLYVEKEPETPLSSVMRWFIDLSGTQNSPPSLPPAPDEYQASYDFSQIQNARQWSYLDSAGSMTFDTTNSRWKGSETYSLLWNSGGHPGQNVDAIRRLTAPKSGTIRIYGVAADTNSGGGDGVIVSIAKGSTTLWSTSIANGGAAVSYDIITQVQSGDTIDFIINKGAVDNSFDSTTFDPHITLQ